MAVQAAQFLPLDRRLKGTPTAVAADGPTDRRCGMNRRRTRRDYLIDTVSIVAGENAKSLEA